MSRFRRMDFVLALCSLGLALVIFLAALAEVNNIQIRFLLPVHHGLDRRGAFPRAGLFLLVSIYAVVAQLRVPLVVTTRGRIFQAVVIALGMAAGLADFSALSCCDTPVFFYLGFPFAWLSGMTPEQHTLKTPALQYLLGNLFAIRWEVALMNVIACLFFWYDAGLLALALKRG